MKKFSFMLMTVMAVTMLFTGCKRDDFPDDDGAKVVATLKQADIIQAAKGAYNVWVDNPEIPTELTVGTTTLTQPQYIYALAKVIVDIEGGGKSDVKVLGYKMADYPERDSYDQLEIAVFNGPANGDETEDLGNIARRMIAAMSDKGQVPNQTLFDRGGSKIAFSTNRATVCFLRALSEYGTSMPATISTDYLSTSATLKGFASQFVYYLEIWENTIAETLSADGSHCSGNNTAWENVHFVPIPHSGGVYPDGEDQYHIKYQPYHNIEVAGVTYTAAQCWGIALKGILDLVTKEGSTVWATERNPETPAHTLGNGKPLNSPIPIVEDWFMWGKYPWYEKADEGGVVKKSGVDVTEVDVAFMVRVFPWHLTRSSQLGMIGNYQVFGTDPGGSLIYEDYAGIIAPMREFLIAARFYKYLLDNNITENVYDAVKNVKFSYDLYNQQQAALSLDKETLDFDHTGGTGTVTVVTKDETWTTTLSGEGVTINPTEGPAGTTEVTITMAKNEGGSRTATITFAVPSGKSKVLTVNQAAAPAPASLKDFATKFVHYLEIWENTVAESLSADGSHNSANGTAWKNVHFVPIPYSGGYPDGEDQYHTKYQPYHNIELAGITYTAAQCWGIALKGVLDLVTTEGSTHWAEARNPASHTLGNGKSFNSPLPKIETWFKWGKYPWYENANDGGPVKKAGVEVTEVDVAYMVRLFPWHLTRSSQLGMIGNYQIFGPGTIEYEDYEGLICPMREFLIAARFYKYLLDNNITENVYNAVKNVKFSYDLYNQEQAAIALTKETLEFGYEGEAKTVTVITKDETWTATIAGEGVTVNPTTGSAGSTEVTVTMAKNEGGSRSATITFAIPSGESKVLTVTQGAAPAPTTIKDFAKEYVKLIPIWEATTGTVNYLKGVGKFDDEFDVENAHYIPEDTKITVAGVEYGLPDVIELAERSYLLLRGMDGNNTSVSGAGNFPAVTGTSMSTTLPETHGYIWAESPYNETGSTSAGNTIVGNGGGLRMGDPQTADGVEKVKIDILDNFAQRHVNWPITRQNKIANMCGYSNNRLPGYYGCFSAKRGLLTYAYFFKYMLDNNLDHARDISADQTFNSYLFGEGIH